MLRKPSRSTGIKALGVCAVLLAAFALFSGFSQPPLDASTKAAVAEPRPANTIVQLVKAVSPAVVNITTKGETRSATWSQRFGHPLPDAWRKFFETPPFSMPGPFGSPGTPRQPRRTQSYGSGVIIDSKGLILTKPSRGGGPQERHHRRYLFPTRTSSRNDHRQRTRKPTSP